MSNDKKRNKFKSESQDARRHDEHKLVHPEDKSGPNRHQHDDKKK